MTVLTDFFLKRKINNNIINNSICIPISIGILIILLYNEKMMLKKRSCQAVKIGKGYVL
jgi:hypothetical protein